MTWESAKGICADILQKMIHKPPTLCSTRAERRTKDRWDEVMNICEARIHHMNLYDPQYVFTVRELASMVAQSVATADAIYRHEIQLHKSLEE